MTTQHIPVPVAPFQLKLKQFCVWIENKFECRLNRFGFALRMALATAVFYAIYYVQQAWLPGARWPLWTLSWLLFAWAAFWAILQIVRRFHDLGRTGGLFWALAVPFWALCKLIGFFPHQWIVWVVLCAWSIWLTIQLFLKRGTDGPNGYECRQPPPA